MLRSIQSNTTLLTSQNCSHTLSVGLLKIQRREQRKVDSQLLVNKVSQTQQLTGRAPTKQKQRLLPTKLAVKLHLHCGVCHERPISANVHSLAQNTTKALENLDKIHVISYLTMLLNRATRYTT